MNSPGMNDRPADWCIAMHGADGKNVGRQETLFALGNGYFVTRACLPTQRADETHYPGTYRAGCYNRLESEIQGERVEVESLVNLPNWTLLIFLAEDGTPFQPELTKDASHEQILDMRSGTTVRTYQLHHIDHGILQVRETRVVSMDDPHTAAMRMEIRSHDFSGQLTIDAKIDSDIENLNIPSFEDYQHRHLIPVYRKTNGDGIAISHVRTIHSEIDIVQGTRTSIRSSRNLHIEAEVAEDGHRFKCPLSPGGAFTIEKICVLETSPATPYEKPEQAQNQSMQAAILIDRATRKLSALRSFDHIKADHEKAWDALWRQTAIELSDKNIAKRLRFDLFHILQTVSPHTTLLDAGIPARGWHGEGYHGHAFWDEMFVMSFLTFRFPEVAKAHLLYRCRRLETAREAAVQAGYRGAMFPWRSARTGEEVTLRYQKNMLTNDWTRDLTCLQRHVGVAIAFDIWRYYLATGDLQFLAAHGAEVILEIARFLASITVYTPERDRFEICSVVGPDEFHTAYPWRDKPGLDNNAYTNIMTAWVLSRVPEVIDVLPPLRCAELRVQLDLPDDELARWDHISRRMYVPFQANGVINQFDAFDRLKNFDEQILPEEWRDARTDWALHASGRDINDYQITKQADALTVFYLLPEKEVRELFARLGYDCGKACIPKTAEYYLSRSAHRSSLSRVVYAGALARHNRELAWKLYCEVLDTDLSQLEGESVAEGIHLAAMGGSVDILQRHFFGVHAAPNALIVEPAVPPQLGRVRMRFQYQGNSLLLESTESNVCVHSCAGNRAINIVSRDEHFRLEEGDKLVLQSCGY